MGAVDVDFLAWKAGIVVPIPEPMSLALLAIGGLALRRRAF